MQSDEINDVETVSVLGKIKGNRPEFEVQKLGTFVLSHPHYVAPVALVNKYHKIKPQVHVVYLCCSYTVEHTDKLFSCRVPT